MIRVDLSGADVAIARLADLQSPSARRRVLTRVARHVIKASIDRTRAQTDLDGKPFAPHARKRRRKMLLRLARRLRIVEIDDSRVVIGWRNRVEEQIGAKQQYGQTATFKREWLEAELDGSRADLDYYRKPATRRQAKALIEAGYKRRTGKGGKKTPSIRWITQHMTIARAGLILKLLRGSKDAWRIRLPARSFLGITDADLTAITALAVNALQTALNEG